MQKHIVRTAILVAVLTATHSLETLAMNAAERAATVLAEARKALGGDDKLRAVKTVQAAGGLRRSMGEMQMEGELEILLEAPDKLRRNEELILPMGTMVRTEVINGDDVWEDSSNRGGPGGHGGMMIRMAPGPGGGAPDPERIREMQRRMRKADLARFALVWLMTTDAPVTFAGVAEAPDGKADVLEVTPAEGPAMRLFIDQETHLPLMITWQGPQPRMMIRRAAPGGPPPNPEQMAREAEAGPPQQATFELRCSEYRKVDGIQLPHQLTRSINGSVHEEWTVKSYKVNAPLKSNTFSK